MSEPKKEDSLRATEVAELDPYNIRGKPVQKAAQELLEGKEESQEQEFEGKRFTQEQRDKLQQQGFAIYQLEKLSLKELVARGLKIAGETSIVEDIADRKSMGSEVAISVKNPFATILKIDSESTKLTEQLELIMQFEEEIKKRIPGVEVKWGDAADYAQIYLLHFEKTNNVLFRDHSVRTITVPYHVSSDPVFIRHNIEGSIKSASVTPEVYVGTYSVNEGKVRQIVEPLIIPK